MGVEYVMQNEIQTAEPLVSECSSFNVVISIENLKKVYITKQKNVSVKTDPRAG
jgi:hypothetical protein